MTGSKLYPAEFRRFINDNVKGTGYQKMAEMLNHVYGTNFTREQIKAYYSRFKLNSGLTGRFPKGHISHNKGVKGIHCSPATELKKGQPPRNCLPVGSEIIDSYGYPKVKVADPNKWRFKHRMVWEAVNGPVPKGSVLIFADGDKTHVSLDNLILITRAQLVRLNQKGLIRTNADLTRTGIIIADICNKIGARRRRQNQKKSEVSHE